jgi:NADP-dependent 3-hydroxy acid dehydrogenase YdfG
MLDRFRIDDRVAIVTGASSGLGVDFAVALAEAGADLALGARREDRLTGTRKLVDATMRTYGRVDILVNNAGVGTAVPATRETPKSSVPSSTST